MNTKDYMEKISTIQPNLLPLKSFYEKLTAIEEIALSCLSKSELKEEEKLLDVIRLLSKSKRSPNLTSIDIIMEYSKKQSHKDPVC